MHTNNIKEANYVISGLLAISLLMLAFMLGFLCNSMAVSYNNYKMPVYSIDYVFEDSRHFTFTEPSSVKYFYLTDIIRTQSRTSIQIWSIGDLLMISSGIGFIVTFAILLKLKSIKNFKNMNKKAYNKFYK